MAKDYFKVEPDLTRIMNKHFTPGRGGRQIRYITRHHLAGVGDTATVWGWWQTRQASAHYVIQPDGRVGQLVWDRDTAWSNANTVSNQESISIEHSNSAGAAQDWPISDAVIVEGARWAAALCRFYKLGRPNFGTNIRDHRNFSATSCPHHLAAGGRYHDRWMSVAQAFYDELTNTAPAPAPAPAPGPVPGDVKVVTVRDGLVVDVSLKQPQTGGISHFAGPTDQSTINGHMALSGEPGRAPRDHWYAAMRWNYCRWEAYQHAGETWLRPVSGTSDLRLKERLNGVKLLVTHHKSGKKVVLRAADTGPRPVKRVIDVSPHVEKAVFGGATDDQVTVELAPADAPLGPYTGPSTPPVSGGTVDKTDARLALEQLGGPEPFEGWDQLGGRTVVNALAAIGENLGIEGMYDPTKREEDGK